MTENNSLENSAVLLNMISKLIQDIERKVLINKMKCNECEELKLLKEKCCDKRVLTSSTAFNGIIYLVQKQILSGSQTVSMFISMLPSIHHYSSLISALGKILLFDLKSQIMQKSYYSCPYSIGEHKHPLIIILKHNQDKSWFEIYLFILNLIRNQSDIKVEHKLEFLKPIFHNIFWNQTWEMHKLQIKIFGTLMMHSDENEILSVVQEILKWKEQDLYFCLFLQDFFIFLLKKRSKETDEILVAWTPMLALAIKWLLINGHDPTTWIKLLACSVDVDHAANSTVLFILAEVIMEIPISYADKVVDICKFIIFTSCNKYVAYKFASIVLNWFVNPSQLATSLLKTFEQIFLFLNEKNLQWKDSTMKLVNNDYFKTFGNTNKDIKFAVDLILISNSWVFDENLMIKWLQNLKDSNQNEMQIKLHSFIQGVILCESNLNCINLCLDILFKVLNNNKETSFSLLCLIFYKLGKEKNPLMQKTYLFHLPKLAIRKENIPLICGILESLKKGNPKILSPFITQLYLLLWKFDNRTYSYLHSMLHEDSLEQSDFECNVSRAIALKEICKLAPHLHAKDLVGVLNKILNQSSNYKSGLPSAIAIEAVTELCRSYVIDAAGAWKAIQPKLSQDSRLLVIKSMCKFFGEIPNLRSGHKYDQLMDDIISILWNYTFFKNCEIARYSFRALSNFVVEDKPLKLFPNAYKVGIKLPKSQEKSLQIEEDIAALTYVPAECWVQFLEKIKEEILSDGGEILVVVIERELNSLPRGVFYLPLEKPEPLTYSYLPSRSVCKVLIQYLQKHSTSVTKCVKEMMRIISHEYTKLLPPLNWSFVEKFMSVDDECLHYSLALLAKQGAQSKSAKLVLENYFNMIEWSLGKLENIIFLYEIMPLLIKAVSYNTLENFLETTISLCLQDAVENHTHCFEIILEHLSKTLKNKNVLPTHKTLIAKRLVKVYTMIPLEHAVIKSYALCATEFPIQSIEILTSIESSNEINGNNFRRGIIISSTIALRDEIKNPLGWLNDFIETAALIPSEQNYIMSTIWTIVRARRDCNHTMWIQEFIWRVQASITDSQSCEAAQMTHFFLDVFLSTIIVLSGYDCFFENTDDFINIKSKIQEIFPFALYSLLHFNDWVDLLPKIALWFQKLSKWKHLPKRYTEVIVQSLMTLKEEKYLKNENALNYTFNLYSQFLH